LNIKLSPGELSILMGRNAAGKSTLVSALTAAGKFEVSGRGPSALSDFRTIVRSTDRTSVRKGPARYNISLPFNTSGGLHGLRRSSHTF
ncbi:MAG: ATP-binding cassette domain-containing protein, partial [Candidatus Hodgkinia cicadicola]